MTARFFCDSFNKRYLLNEIQTKQTRPARINGPSMNYMLVL